jgi:hypothetical protein
VLGLLADSPFPDAPPRFVRARLFRYRFTAPGEPGWWRRDQEEEYLPPLSLDSPSLREILRRMEWE